MNAPIPYARLREICREQNLASFRFGEMREVSKDFGHSTLVLDRVASEHSATICERMRKARMHVVETERRG